PVLLMTIVNTSFCPALTEPPLGFLVTARVGPTTVVTEAPALEPDCEPFVKVARPSVEVCTPGAALESCVGTRNTLMPEKSISQLIGPPLWSDLPRVINWITGAATRWGAATELFTPRVTVHVVVPCPAVTSIRSVSIWIRYGMAVDG